MILQTTKETVWVDAKQQKNACDDIVEARRAQLTLTLLKWILDHFSTGSFALQTETVNGGLCMGVLGR